MKNISLTLFTLVLSTNLLISTGESQQPLSMFPSPDPVYQPHLFPMPESYSMPDTLEFLLYTPNHGGPPYPYRVLVPNIHPDLPACLYALTRMDQYGNPKIYPTCSGTKIHNRRNYPPLYSGDVFPVLDQLYYYEASIGERGKRGIAYRPHRAIKVLEAKYHNISSTILPKGQMILPLTPLDVVPNEDPMYYRSQMICRKSFLPMNTGAVSLVKIREIEERVKPPTVQGFWKDGPPLPNVKVLIATIYTGNSGKGGGHPDMGAYVDAFQTVKEYRVGDILVSHYKDPEKSSTEDAPQLAVGFKITKIVPPDPERNRVFQTVEGEKTGRLIGWVELDPTPIPVDENGKPIGNSKSGVKP